MEYLVLIFILILIFLGLSMIPNIARRYPFGAFLLTLLLLAVAFMLAARAIDVLIV